MTLPSENSTVSIGLNLIQESLQSGDRKTAYDLSLKLTRDHPTSEKAWLCLAIAAETPQETVGALSRVIGLNENNTEAHKLLNESMGVLLSKDPFLIYRGETPTQYLVHTPANMDLILPKIRSIQEPYPFKEPQPARRAYLWLGLSLVGLIPAGLGTLVCAPWAILEAARLWRKPKSTSDRQRSRVIIWLSILLWSLALLESGLFLLHLP